MNFWTRHKIKKAVHHLLHEARHARHMREDIVSADKIVSLKNAEDALKDAWENRDYILVDKAADDLMDATHHVYPPHKHPRMRENIEILVVAIAVAMAFRTFYVQPFRIPTGSMQPTLFGITYEPQKERGLMDRFPLSIIPFITSGERYLEIKAKASGVVEFREEVADESHYIVRIAGIPHVVPNDMPVLVQYRTRNHEGTTVQKGDVIASGRKKLGDHIFVNRFWYNFSPPERGDIFVFSTRDIKHPNIRPDNYYIKRMVGMPGERIEIDPPYLVADGKRVTEPYAFRRQAEGERDGYHGYILVGSANTLAYLRRPGDFIQLNEGEFLPMGDNTRSSLDGRYFGAVKKESIIGPAFMIYWPFSKRWGFVE